MALTTGSQEVRDATLEDFVAHDGAMQVCLERARVAARTDLPVLILGESGAGKTILARAIHNSSRRNRGPFVSFNAAALSDTLLDSQLFGHERGAFTGAHQRVKGKFELGRKRVVRCRGQMPAQKSGLQKLSWRGLPKLVPNSGDRASEDHRSNEASRFTFRVCDNSARN